MQTEIKRNGPELVILQKRICGSCMHLLKEYDGIRISYVYQCAHDSLPEKKVIRTSETPEWCPVLQAGYHR